MMRLMDGNIIRIGVFDTVYSLFLYFLKFGYDSEDILILSSGIPIEVENNINHVYFPDIKLVGNKNNIFVWFYKNFHNGLKLIYGIIKLRIRLFFKTRNKQVEVYGQAHLTFSFPLYEYENSYLIEDGLGNYLDLQQPPKFNKILSKLLHFFGIYITNIKQGFGTHHNIKKIYLTKNNPPELIKDKVELMDLDELWNHKSDIEKKKILEIFNLEGIEEIFGQNITLLLTEPFSEHELLPFEEEISIYGEFIEKYPNIIIKTHPRENKDYAKLFSGVKVINVPFPVELLKYVGVKIDKIVTICSTAALNFQDVEIEIYDKKTSSDHINNAIRLLNEKLNDKEDDK